VLELALEEVRDRRELDVRVGRHVHPPPGRELDRTHVVEKYERPDATVLHRRKGASNGESRDVARSGEDQALDRVRAAVRVQAEPSGRVSMRTSVVVISFAMGQRSTAA